MFLFGFSVRQDYSTHFELSQVVKMGDPQEKNPDHLQAELGLPHVIRARLELTAAGQR